jgi:hypothetical protein
MTVAVTMILFLDMLIQFTAITWLKDFIAQSGSLMLAFASGILTAVMPCLAYDDDGRRSILLAQFCYSVSNRLCRWPACLSISQFNFFSINSCFEQRQYLRTESINLSDATLTLY